MEQLRSFPAADALANFLWSRPLLVGIFAFEQSRAVHVLGSPTSPTASLSGCLLAPPLFPGETLG